MYYCCKSSSGHIFLTPTYLHLFCFFRNTPLSGVTQQNGLKRIGRYVERCHVCIINIIITTVIIIFIYECCRKEKKQRFATGDDGGLEVEPERLLRHMIVFGLLTIGRGPFDSTESVRTDTNI